MRFSTVSVLALASSALAAPVVVYETQFDYQTVTVFAGQQAPAPTANAIVVVTAAPPPPPAPTPEAAPVEAPAPPPPAPKPETSSPPPPPPAPTTPPPPPPPAPTTSAPAPAASSALPGAPDAFAQQLLDSHNEVRPLHSAPVMEWNNTLADFAQGYLDNQNCVFAHSGGPYGENIAIGYSTPTAAADAWYNEISQYNFAAGQFSEGTGHFTQMVWVGSTQLGCAQVDCSGRQFVACEYYPRGNIIGFFTENVLEN